MAKVEVPEYKIHERVEIEPATTALIVTTSDAILRSINRRGA